MNKRKKAYTLLITIVLISLFSYLGISILQTKSFANKNIENQYLYIQAKNHKEFFKDYLINLEESNLDEIEHIEIKNTNFKIEAFIENKNSNYEILIFVKSKEFDISIYERLIR